MADFRMENIPWLTPHPNYSSQKIPVLPVAATPAQQLLHAHLCRGSRARREAATFALALTQPAAAAAVRAFLNRNKTDGNK